jgi:glycosyltransferase involved in cell wall biosynthesis
MPKVAIIGTRGYPSYYGGFETAVRHLAPYLHSKGWDVTVYGRDPAVNSSLVNGIRVVNTKGLEANSMGTLTHGLSSFMDLAKNNYDVALVMNVANGFWLPLARLLKVPTLVNVDGIEWERAKWGKVAKFVFYCGALMTAKHADALVSDAKAIRHRWQAEFRRDSVYIPYGGSSSEALPPLEPGLEKDKYVLLVARLVPENSIQPFLDSIPLLAARYKVVVVGSNPGSKFEAQLSSISAMNPNVLWLGHISDEQRLHSLWKNCGVYFHGHTVGGTNPALVQAMALGAPIVAIDTPFSREVLGEGGVFVNPAAERISDAILDLLDDGPARVIKQRLNTQTALDFFTWEDVCKRYEESLKVLVDRRHR